jgi:FkbM family methyltransferase
MSVYAVSRIQQLMGCFVNQAVAALVENNETIEKVKGWLKDAASREQYERELVFMVLSKLIGNDAMRYAGNVSINEWAGALKKAEALLASGELSGVSGPPDNFFHWFTCTFVMNQYQHGDVFGVREGDVFLDCGACCGDTAIWALSKGAEKVYSFEPDPEAIGYFRRNIAHYGQGRVEIITAGLGIESGYMTLVTNGHLGLSRLVDASEGGDIPVITLDDWARENRIEPDFIKMDLEGSEVSALKGARATIARYKPRLAICLYHQLSDMWTIPVLLREIVPEYRFWCHKNHPVWEFVLYATV